MHACINKYNKQTTPTAHAQAYGITELLLSVRPCDDDGARAPQYCHANMAHAHTRTTPVKNSRGLRRKRSTGIS